MTLRRVACPRCGQDWLYRITLVHLGRVVINCPECDAMWQHISEIGPYSFEDYSTFMERHGRSPGDPCEIEILGQLKVEEEPSP